MTEIRMMIPKKLLVLPTSVSSLKQSYLHHLRIVSLIQIQAQPTQQNDNNFDEAAMEEDDEDNSGGSSGGDDLAEEGFHSKCFILIGRRLWLVDLNIQMKT